MSTMTQEQPTLGSPEFERRALGVALRDRTSATTITSTLTEKDLTDPGNRALFRVISTRLANGQPLDPPLIVADLDRLDSEYGIENSHLLVAETYSGAGAKVALDEYLGPIRAYAKARSLLDVSRALSAYAMTSDGDEAAVDAGAAAASSALLDLGAPAVEAAWQDLGEIAAEVADAESMPRPLFSSGFTDLDRMLAGGFYPGQAIIVAGRPGSGKSTFAMDLARHASLNQGVAGIVVEMEMTGGELAQRAIAAEAGVPFDVVRRPYAERSDEHANLIDAAVDRMRGSGVMIAAAGGMGIDQVKRLITSAVQQYQAQYAIIDYLQLMTSDGQSRQATREQIVSSMSRELKALALRLGIAVIIVAQLNRGPEQRADKMPLMSDLRESGQLEQDGDVILLLHPQTTPETLGTTDVIVAKQRNGKTGPVSLVFQGHMSRFANLAHSSTF